MRTRGGVYVGEAGDLDAYGLPSLGANNITKGVAYM